MPIETIELTGSAITGIGNGGTHAMVASLPRKVCLGRIKPKSRPACLTLTPYIESMSALAGVLPVSTNYRAKAAESISRMYMNDQYGCCVFSGKAHNLGVWSANDSDSAGIVLATDAEIKKQYFDYTGGRDVGANIAEVLDIMRSRGFVASGKTYKIDGYVSVDNTKKDLVKAAQLLFGSSSIGIDLPSAWTSNAVWDVTTSRIVGGHDVSPIDYDDQGVHVSSWGRVYLMTWAAFLSTKWVSEYYAMIAPLWYNGDLIAPSGLKVDQLKADLAKLANGVVPDITPPSPIDPVPPYHVKINSPIGAGSYEGGKIVFGSNMQPGEYGLILGGEGPPPVVPQ